MPRQLPEMPTKLSPCKRLPTEIKLHILRYYVLFSFMGPSTVRLPGSETHRRAIHDALYIIDGSRFVFGRLMMMEVVWSVFKEINSSQRQKSEGLTNGILHLVYVLAHKLAEEPALYGTDREASLLLR